MPSSDWTQQASNSGAGTNQRGNIFYVIVNIALL